MARGPLPCAVNDVCLVHVWSHTVAGLFLATIHLRRHSAVHCGLEDGMHFQTLERVFFSRYSSSSCFKMIYSFCWMMNWDITSPLCVPSDWAFVHYKMDLTSWTCSPPEVLLTSTLLLPLTHGLVTSDGQWGVNPLLLQTPATVKSGVTQKPVWLGKYTVYPRLQ